MHRRAFLAAVAGASLAGCTGSGSSPGGTPAPTLTPTPTPTEAPTPTPTTETPAPTTTAEPASFELVSVEAPERVEIGSTATFAFTVKNVGEQAGTFSTTISYRMVGEDSWSEPSSPWSQWIEPGESVTLTSGEFSHGYMDRLDFRIDEFGDTFSVQFVAKTLGFGDTYTNPNNVDITVKFIDTATGYEYESNGYEFTKRPAEGNIFAFVKAVIENQSGQPERIPTDRDFSILLGDGQFDSVHYWDETRRYEGGNVQPGIVREGWIAYEVPEDFDRDNAVVVWSESNFQGDLAVYWSEGGTGV